MSDRYCNCSTCADDLASLRAEVTVLKRRVRLARRLFREGFQNTRAMATLDLRRPLDHAERR